MNISFLFWLTFLVKTAASFKHFQSRIPNGESIPHPCKPNYLWHGVGHLSELGGGDRNKFGKDFQNAGMKWTVPLCQKDSDGDGKTNGEELGDPHCIWRIGEIPKKITDLSHPGVCEPYDSDTCRTRNNWVNCDQESFKCDAIKNKDVKNVTLRFPKTQVPNKETNYFCMIFELPSDDDYHLIATTPLIDNEYVMHHTLLSGCDDSVKAADSAPQPCGMGSGACRNIIGGWTVGAPGECVHKDVGYRIGQNGYKFASMQFHWNNPELRSDYTDSSGMTLYITPNRRPFNAGQIVVGQNYLEIPPGKDRIEATSVCNGQSTKQLLKGNINVITAYNHMHYLGREQYIQHYRDGIKLNSITQETEYNYDKPASFEYEDAIKIKPGDELKTTCVFKSKSRSLTVFQGDGTSDEMCYGFLIFYPIENITSPVCTSWKSITVIDPYSSNVQDGCNSRIFFNHSHPDMKPLYDKVKERCLPFSKCLEECKAVVKELKSHPCMKGDMADAIKWQARHSMDIDVLKFFSSVESCDLTIFKDELSMKSGINFEVHNAGNYIRFADILTLWIFYTIFCLSLY